MRRAARIDQTQTAIVEALRKVGAGVLSMASLGRGAPDLLVAYRSVVYCLECKSKGGKLTPDQVKWINDWPAPVYVVETPAAALRVVTGMGEVDPQ